MAPRGRPAKTKKVSVTLNHDEIQHLKERLGYKEIQDLLDDLALGEIPKSAISPSKPGMATSEKSPVQITTPVSSKSPKGVSWADKVETEEAQCSLQTVSEVIGEKLEALDIQKETEKDPEVRNWAEVIKQANQGFVMKYIAPSETVEFTKEEWEAGDMLWKHAVVCSVLAFKPSYSDVEKWVSINWKHCKPRISHVKPGVYLFDFDNEQDKVKVLGRRWTFFNKSPMAFKAWNPSMDLNNIEFDKIPVWIQLPGLNSRFWGAQALSKLVSFIGRPISADPATINRSRLSYARVLVEVDVSKDLHETIPITGPEKEQMKQAVRYEFLMPRCTNCNMTGHGANICRKPRKNLPDQKRTQEDGKLDSSNVVERTETPPQETTVLEEQPNTDKAPAIVPVEKPTAVTVSAIGSTADKAKQKESRSSSSSKQGDEWTTVQRNSGKKKIPPVVTPARGSRPPPKPNV